MNERNTVQRFLCKTAALFSALFFFSCDTEYVDKVNTIPGDVVKVPGYNQIESFTLKDTENNTLNAALTENEIIITWSNHMALPETIKPTIILGQEAAIAPASGTEIPFKNGAVFTVTSKAGTKKQYTLKIDLRQKQPRTWTAHYAETLYKGLLQSQINNGQSDHIDNLWLSQKETKVYFVAVTDQKEYTAEVVYLGKGTGTSPFFNYGVYYFLPENMPLGTYDLRIKNGAYTLQNSIVENRFKIEIADSPDFNVERYGFPATKNKGETIEIRGSQLNTITAVELFNYDSPDVAHQLEIVSVSSYKAVFKIPSNTPPGKYFALRFKRGSSDPAEAYSPITVK